jgi:hypothetical protein
VSFVYSAEDHVQINARCRYRIEQAGMARFRLKLPAGAKLVSLAARDLRGHEVAAQADGTLVTAVMQSPVVGEQTIDLAYRLPRTPGQDVEAVPVGVEDSEIQKVEHFVGVLRDEYGLVSALPKAGLQPLNDGEKLPFLPANVSTGALATAYAATGPEWALVLRRSEVESGGGPEAIVTLCVLKTVLAADGGVRSVATYTLRNRTLQFMRIGMPPEAKLWGVLVDGQPVTASQTSQQGRTVLQIPIPRMALTDLPISVTVVYEEARVELPATLRSFTPQAPEVLDRKQMPVVETYWKVYVPEGYETTRTGGSVKDAAESVLVAGMIKTSVDETKQMLTIAETSKSESQRRGALRNLAKLGQELSDKVTVLQSMSQQVDVDEQRRVGRDEWGKQMEGNKAVQQEAGEYQKKLQARGKEIEEAVTGGAGLEEQRAFMDKYHFLDNRWRGGSLYAKPKAAPVQPPRGEVSARELNTLQPFAGFRKGELPAAPAARVTQDLRQIPEEGGMPEAREHQVGIELGATDLRVEEKGTTLTFRLVEEQPTLTLRLRSVSSTWHWAAVGALLALAAGAAVALRMRTRAE